MHDAALVVRTVARLGTKDDEEAACTAESGRMCIKAAPRGAAGPASAAGSALRGPPAARRAPPQDLPDQHRSSATQPRCSAPGSAFSVGLSSSWPGRHVGTLRAVDYAQG